MRRGTAVVAAVCLAPLLALAVAGPAASQPTPTPLPEAGDAQEPPARGEQVCTILDYRLVELSGMAATEDRYIVVNDGNEFFDRKAIFFLDDACQLVDQISLPDQRDPEDLAIDRAEDTLWVGDIGDNFAGTPDERPSVALWKVPLAPGQQRLPVIHRLGYPDGPRNAEALLLDGDGTPIIITYTVDAAEVYVPAEPLRENNPHEDAVPLEQVGEITLPETETQHPLGPAARQAITGAANSPDGDRVVLRTLTDAFEFDVDDGDVVTAITTGEPRVTPLPDEPQGEAITYSTDGGHVLTVSESVDFEGFDPVILRYVPTPPPPPEPTPTATATPAGAGSDDGSLFDDLQLQDIIYIIAAIGVIGLLMVAAGVIGILRARRGGGGADAGHDAQDDDGAALAGRGGAAAGRAAAPVEAFAGESQPGWEPDPDGHPAAGVYTSSAAGYGGTEYGGQPDPDPAYGGAGYPDPAYGGAGYPDPAYGGAGYPDPEHGGAGYPDPEHGGYGYAQPDYPAQPYQQSWPEGHREQDAGHAYSGGYAEPEPPYPDQPPAGGTYVAGTYGSPSPTSDYSDDLDYPYEFREPGRW